MYESPIELIVEDIGHQIAKQLDEEIYQAVLHYVPNIDKSELLRALKYDRNQYEKGYADGLRDGKPQWISAKDRLPEGEKTVVVTDIDGCCEVWTHNGNYWVDEYGWLQEFKEYSYWMPLPEPPKEV